MKKDSGSSAAGILDLLQASEEVGALEYNPNRWALAAPLSTHRTWPALGTGSMP